jgi:hypothetical protein
VEQSILISTKKILGVEESYTAFDLDILTHINSVFSTLQQLGVGPANGFAIEDDTVTWDAFLGTDVRLSNVKSYMYLRVRMLFDPPATSYLITAMQSQILELEVRMNWYREETAWVDPDPAPDPVSTWW